MQEEIQSSFYEEQGLLSVESTCLPLMWPDLIQARWHIWVDFVLCSRFVLRVFLQVVQFSSLCKNQHSKFNSSRIEDRHENQLRLMWLAL